jgi:Uma2 family endonuclease
MAQPQAADVEREAEPVVIKEGVTVEEYLAMPESMTPYNLIEGRLYMSAAPTPRHQEIVGRLYVNLIAFADPIGARVYLSPTDFMLSDGTVVQPDISYISPERLDIVRDRVVGAPDIAVEVLSPGTRRFDRVRKLRTYEKNGVREVWLIDPDGQTVTVFFNGGTQWDRERSGLFGDDIPSTIAPVGSGGLEQFA